MWQSMAEIINSLIKQKKRKKKEICNVCVKDPILLLKCIVHLKQLHLKAEIIKFCNLYYAERGELAKTTCIVKSIDACYGL